MTWVSIKSYRFPFLVIRQIFVTLRMILASSWLMWPQSKRETRPVQNQLSTPADFTGSLSERFIGSCPHLTELDPVEIILNTECLNTCWTARDQLSGGSAALTQGDMKRPNTQERSTHTHPRQTWQPSRTWANHQINTQRTGTLQHPSIHFFTASRWCSEHGCSSSDWTDSPLCHIRDSAFWILRSLNSPVESSPTLTDVCQVSQCPHIMGQLSTVALFQEMIIRPDEDMLCI